MHRLDPWAMPLGSAFVGAIAYGGFMLGPSRAA
jgi:hypothetical protein